MKTIFKPFYINNKKQRELAGFYCYSCKALSLFFSKVAGESCSYNQYLIIKTLIIKKLLFLSWGPGLNSELIFLQQQILILKQSVIKAWYIPLPLKMQMFIFKHSNKLPCGLHLQSKLCFGGRQGTRKNMTPTLQNISACDVHLLVFPWFFTSCISLASASHLQSAFAWAACFTAAVNSCQCQTSFTSGCLWRGAQVRSNLRNLQAFCLVSKDENREKTTKVSFA